MVGNGLKAAAHGMKGKLLVWGGCWCAAGDWNLSVGTRKTKLLGTENSGAAATGRTTTTAVAEELLTVRRRETALLLSTAETEERKCSYYRSRLLLLSVAG
ncbi:hypothetical protein H0E87_010628 [Populus deltoides]|uniref:Uncharacterized protein n=1 Tax=Populus deltoides TaxID=3696 RepID=A0A8T2YU92_POPDE|nr:hypothetical protein H0E87_010628 [Populus deltoides]